MKIEECTKLWQLLEKAIEDLRFCENEPEVSINMSVFFVYNYSDCLVCLAGAMLVADGYSRTESLCPSELHPTVGNAMRAVNDLRRGHINGAIRCFYGTRPVIYVKEQDVCEYHVNKESFYKDIDRVLGTLKELDL